DTTGIDLSSLKQALSGAERVRLSPIEAFEKKFDCPNLISPCYGLAEATLAVAIWPRHTPLRLDSSGKFLSVGPPCRGVSVRIADEAGPVGPGGEGGSCGRGPGGRRGDAQN